MTFENLIFHNLETRNAGSRNLSRQEDRKIR